VHAGVGVGAAPLVQGIEPVQQHGRRAGLVAAQGEAAVVVDPGELVAADGLGDEHVADALLGRVHAEGDADGDERLRPPGGDGVVGRVLRLALAADALDDAHAAQGAEQVIGDLLAGLGVRCAPRAEAADHGGGLVLVEAEQHHHRQVAGGQAALIGDQLVRRDGVQLVQARQGRARRRALHPDPALGAAGLLVLGDLAAQGDLLRRGRGVDLPQQPVQRGVGAVLAAVRVDGLMDARDLDAPVRLHQAEQLRHPALQAGLELDPF